MGAWTGGCGRNSGDLGKSRKGRGPGMWDKRTRLGFFYLIASTCSPSPISQVCGLGKSEATGKGFLMVLGVLHETQLPPFSAPGIESALRACCSAHSRRAQPGRFARQRPCHVGTLCESGALQCQVTFKMREYMVPNPACSPRC